MAHRPLSICASVPQKTRNIDSVKSMTVKRSEANGLRMRLIGFKRSMRRAGVLGGVASGGTGAVVICVDVLFMSGSLAVHEANRLHETFEGGLLFADQFRRSLHFDEPGSAAVDDPGAENALWASRIAPRQIDVGRLAAGDIQAAQILLDLRVVEGVEAKLPAPAVDIGRRAAAFAGQRHHGNLREVLAVADQKDRGTIDTLAVVGRLFIP